MASVTLKQIWDELINAGASPVQAAGIMGNMMNESSFNPEANAVDSNGARSYGLIQWNAASYPSASSLVTGNPLEDMRRQIRFLVQTGGLHAASGASASQAGGAFAANYERCQGCQPGGTQWSERSANASSIFSDAKSGKWPTGNSGGAGGGNGGGGTSGGTGATLTKFSGGYIYPFGPDWPGIPVGAFPGITNILDPAQWATDLSRGFAGAIEKVFGDLLKYLVGAAEVITGAVLILIAISQISPATGAVLTALPGPIGRMAGFMAYNARQEPRVDAERAGFDARQRTTYSASAGRPRRAQPATREIPANNVRILPATARKAIPR